MRRLSAACAPDRRHQILVVARFVTVIGAGLALLGVLLGTQGDLHEWWPIAPLAPVLVVSMFNFSRPRHLTGNLAEDVWLDDDRVHIRRGKTQQDITLRDILYVRLSTRFDRATLVLRRHGPLGKQVSFMLPPKGTDARQFVVRELPLRIEDEAWSRP